MEKENETFDNAITDVLAAQIMNNFCDNLRNKIVFIIENRDPKELRHFVRNINKSLIAWIPDKPDF